ncbi:MAG TPA: choice-of-anchor D domain-containing protein [Blastocatellia bacterium]|nr:choice-of-anchor D domain-containing protein [Blastocatellia bacterium]
MKRTLVMGFSIIALLSLAAIAQTTGAPPSVTLSPSSIDFKDQVVGKASRPQRITLTNTGGKPLYVNSVTIVDGESSDFALSGDTCTGSTIGPGKSCVIDVSFTPSATGSRKSTLTITDNAVDSPQRVPLYGSGINSAAVPPSGKPPF